MLHNELRGCSCLTWVNHLGIFQIYADVSAKFPLHMPLGFRKSQTLEIPFWLDELGCRKDRLRQTGSIMDV